MNPMLFRRAQSFFRRGAFVLGWVALIGHDSDTYGASAGPLVAAAHGGLIKELTAGLAALQDLPQA